VRVRDAVMLTHAGVVHVTNYHCRFAAKPEFRNPSTMLVNHALQSFGPILLQSRNGLSVTK